MSQFLTQQDAHLGYRFTAAYVKAVQDSGLLDVCWALATWARWIDGWLDLIMMNDILLFFLYIHWYTDILYTEYGISIFGDIQLNILNYCVRWC